MLSNVMAGLEGSIVATALPAMMAELHGIKLMSWVVTIYMLLMAVSSPIWTKLAERFGYKQMFVLGTLLFTIGSLGEGLAINMLMVIVARALMGLGAGVMIQLPFVIYGMMYQADERRRVIGNTVAAYSFSTIAGPIVGNMIVTLLDWRWVFFINIPIGIYMAFIVWKNFDLKTDHTKKSIDFAGSASLSIAVIAIMLLFQMMGNAVINLPLLIALLVISLLFFTGFYFAEKRAVDPIVPLELFKNPSFIAKNIMFFMQYGFFGFYTNYLPTWGQGVMGATALVGGMVLIPSAIMLVIGTRNVNHLIQKVGEKRTIYIGFAIMVLGALFLFSLPEHASILMLFVATAILGTAFGIVNITLQVAVQESVAKHLIGAATAVNALLRTMGTTLVLSGLSIALNRTFTDATAHNPKLTTTLLNQISDAQALKNIPTALVAPLRHTLFNGMHLLALISGLLLFIALFVNWLDPWKKGLE